MNNFKLQENKQKLKKNLLQKLEKYFVSFFEGNVAGKKGNFKKNPNDSYYPLVVDFLEAALGAKKRVTMPDGKIFEINIPAGALDGSFIMVPKSGGQGNITHKTGDAYLEIMVTPHDFFNRKNNNILFEKSINIAQSLLGDKVLIPTLHGNILLTIPPRTTHGTKFRLKNKGIKNKNNEIGDQIITIKIELPNKIDAQLEKELRKMLETVKN